MPFVKLCPKWLIFETKYADQSMQLKKSKKYLMLLPSHYRVLLDGTLCMIVCLRRAVLVSKAYWYRNCSWYARTQSVADQIAVRKMKYAATGEEDRCGRWRGWRRLCRRNRSRNKVNYLLRLYISPFQRVGKYRLKWLQYQIVFLFVVRHTKKLYVGTL
jgi:hypothetical protein